LNPEIFGEKSLKNGLLYLPRDVKLLYLPRGVKKLYLPLKRENRNFSGMSRDVIGFKMDYKY